MKKPFTSHVSILENKMEVKQQETGEEKVSALKDNIISKGQNAYYYAHAKNLGEQKNFGGAVSS